jgi:hypothetical protein
MPEPTIQNGTMSSDRTKILLTGVTIGILALAQPAAAETAIYGPGASGVSPAYSLPIHVVDAVVGTLRLENRPIWRAARDEALSEWGIPFTVTRLPESSLPYLFDDNIGTVGYDGMLIPDAILLVRNRMSYSTEQGGYSAAVNGGIVVFSPWAPLWKPWGGLSGVIAHEIGHALGFNHGGTGVMAGADRVNDVELALAKGYYA